MFTPSIKFTDQQGARRTVGTRAAQLLLIATATPTPSYELLLTAEMTLPGDAELMTPTGAIHACRRLAQLGLLTETRRPKSPGIKAAALYALAPAGEWFLAQYGDQVRA